MLSNDLYEAAYGIAKGKKYRLDLVNNALAAKHSGMCITSSGYNKNGNELWAIFRNNERISKWQSTLKIAVLLAAKEYL
jgi:hypothetical protein